MVARPYGSWTSPITSDLVVAEAIRLDQVALDGDTIYWTESQPQKQGRCFIYRAAAGGEPEAVTPDDAHAYNVRTRVHEYGGGAFAVQDGTVFFSNFADQRLYRQEAGQSPRALTPAAVPASALRYADGVIDRRRGRLICVHEDHTRPGQAINTLASVDLSGAEAPRVLVSGNDFYSTPRLSPDGARLAWLTWNHPDMPWVAAEVWIGEVEADGTVARARRVAGGPDEAVFQPNWSPDGDLYFVSDRGSGWWNLYRERDGTIEPLAPMEAEFGQAHWNFAHVDLRLRLGGADRLLLRPGRRLAAGPARSPDQALRSDHAPLHEPRAASRRRRAGGVPGRLALRSDGPRRARPRHRDSPDHPALCRTQQ